MTEMMQSSRIRFCQASFEDSDVVKNIAKRVIYFNYTSFLGLDAVEEFISSGMSDKEIDDGLINCTVMILEDTIIGFTITKENLLHLIMIDVPYQNQGYGSELLAYIEAYLFSEYDEIHLQTFLKNKNALKFYLKNGWISDESSSMNETELLVVKKIVK